MKDSMKKDDTQISEDPSTTKESKSGTISDRIRISRGYPLPMFGSKKYLHDLGVLIEFQLVIIEMQRKLAELKEKKVNVKILEEGVKRIDRLIAVYEGFDGIYVQANFYAQKALKLEKDLMEAYDAIVKLKQDNDKKDKIINWKGDI